MIYLKTGVTAEAEMPLSFLHQIKLWWTLYLPFPINSKFSLKGYLENDYKSATMASSVMLLTASTVNSFIIAELVIKLSDIKHHWGEI